jgi:hypothetical protein
MVARESTDRVKRLRGTSRAHGWIAIIDGAARWAGVRALTLGSRWLKSVRYDALEEFSER